MTPLRERMPDDRYGWLLVPLAVVLVGVLLVFFVFFHYTTVEGDSMKPTLLPEDRLLLTKGYGQPRRGDVVVFVLDENGREVEVVKRVVGIPGDSVVTKGDLAWVNGEPEPKGFDVLVGASQRRTGPSRVPEGSLFVLGDNRAVSLDSRFIGFVRLDYVLGRAVAVFSPVTRIRTLDLGK
ncbi:MAG TPA: signal peptidase I [Coriobacteriia bacterium]